MSLRLSINEIDRIQNRPLFFDTNILVFLFGSNYKPSNKQAKDYSTIFRICLTEKLELCIDIIVLSEFINTELRRGYDNYIEINQFDKKKCDFKKFRSTEDGIRISQEVEDIIKKRVLKHFKMVGKSFDTSDIISINLPKHDFNDALIIKTCKAHQCVLVTHDKDFINADLDILTANNKLLIS